MKNRKPFDLKYILVAYNALQVVLSLKIVYEVIFLKVFVIFCKSQLKAIYIIYL
jgi:hypothetical protein